MNIKKLQRVVVDALEDVKGQDIRVFDTVGLTALFDAVAIASGTSNRQTRALAHAVRDKVKAAGGQVLSVEGEDTGEWVLVDLGDLSYQEAADVLEIPVGTVMSRLHRGRRVLKRALADHAEEGTA